MDLLGLDSTSSSDSEYYVDPLSSSYRPPSVDQPQPPRELDLSSSSSSTNSLQHNRSTADLNSFNTPTSKGNSLGIASTPSSNGLSSSGSFDFLSDPFGPSPQQQTQQFSFANFDNFKEEPTNPPPSSKVSNPVSSTMSLGEDRYAALKDLDSLFKTGTSDTWANTNTNSTGVAAASTSSTTSSWSTSSTATSNWSTGAFASPWGTTQTNASNPFAAQVPPVPQGSSNASVNSWSKSQMNGSPFGMPQQQPQQQQMQWGGMSTSQSINFPPTQRNWNNPNPFLPSATSGGSHSSNPFL